MIWLRTKELYALFLDSEWWRSLSRRKRESARQCSRCPKMDDLQCHHLIYRESWFDTTENDLEVLCRICHEAEHGIDENGHKTPQSELRTVLWEHYQTVKIYDRKHLNYLRQTGAISKAEFRRRLPEFPQDNFPKGNRKKKTRAFRRRQQQQRAWLASTKVPQGDRSISWKGGLNFTHKNKWVNRGTSSN